jgi:hypothetical protein
MKEKERNAVLARLTSTDAASLKQHDINTNAYQHTMDEYNAVDRLMSTYTLSMLGADDLRKIMVKHLQVSDLTMNFIASNLFASQLKGGLLNTFERPGHTTKNYLETRNRTEEVLFGYSDRKNHTGGKPGIFDRLKKFGNYIDNPEFAPSMRPKYGALNFTNHQFGAAPTWGRSFMVLKEHVKHNCTFTDFDSFKYESSPAGGLKVATFTQMDRIITNLNPNMLDKLNTMISTLGSRLEPRNYIEAQIHGDIRFNRDVAKMYIDTSDVINTDNPMLREHIDKFARKNGIPLRYI